MLPIVSLYARNVTETLPRQLIAPLLISVASAAVLWLVLFAVVRDARRSALLASLVVLLFFTFEHIDDAIDALFQYFWIERGARYEVPPAILCLVTLGIAAGLATTIVRKARSWTRTTAFLNVFALIGVVWPAGMAAWTRAHSTAPGPRVAPVLARGLQSAARPDIYYIILDAYARTDVMKELFDLDNRPFLRHLEERGFYVAGRSTTNYCQTPLSLSSSLNAVFLDDLVQGLGTDQTELGRFIGENAVARTLRPLGYKFVSFSTGFDPTEHPESDAYYTPFPHMSNFHRMLIDGTPLARVIPKASLRDGTSAARERILYLLEHVPDVTRDRAPTFTFAHILAPHPPFVFGEGGEDITASGTPYHLTDGQAFVDKLPGNREEYRRRYRAQAAFITARVQAMVDRILEQSPEPPIIIVQSDHGSGMRLDMTSLERTDLHERMSILNAYHFPGGNYSGLNDRISPINSFRVVLNTFFGAGLPLLPDRSFYSTWPEPYRFIDVTDAVRSPDPAPNAGGGENDSEAADEDSSEVDP
jgi:hypothetical protein